jgi:hypothetical protein
MKTKIDVTKPYVSYFEEEKLKENFSISISNVDSAIEAIDNCFKYLSSHAKNPQIFADIAETIVTTIAEYSEDPLKARLNIRHLIKTMSDAFKSADFSDE